MSADGRLRITMLQGSISQQSSAAFAAEEQDDLAQEELLERVDVRTCTTPRVSKSFAR